MTTYRLTRLPFGVNCSPFIMTAVLRQHLNLVAARAEDYDKVMLELLRDSFYVDDCVASVDSDQEAVHFKELGVSALQEASMELRKWRSNGNINDDSQPPDGKVLGVTWHSRQDTLTFQINVTAKQHWTKRILLHAVASLFDPLGIISPYVVRGKMVIQELWKKGVSWDEILETSLQKQLGLWWGEATQLGELHFSRWIEFTGEPIVVHLFTDASEKAYGYAIYAMVGLKSFLLFAKAKVASVKSQPLARLELQAAFIGTRALRVVFHKSRMSFTEVHAWTDSMTVKHWISHPPY